MRYLDERELTHVSGGTLSSVAQKVVEFDLNKQETNVAVLCGTGGLLMGSLLGAPAGIVISAIVFSLHFWKDLSF